MKNKLYIMCGCPGAGKTFYAKQHFPNAIYISRDEIRFAMVPETDQYFARENEVFNVFTAKINDALRGSLDVVADATHLTKKSRYKLLSHLRIDKNHTDIIFIVMETPLNICLEQNEKRRGTRSYVPQSTLRRMFYSFEAPNFNEYYGLIDKIYGVKMKGDNA